MQFQQLGPSGRCRGNACHFTAQWIQALWDLKHCVVLSQECFPGRSCCLWFFLYSSLLFCGLFSLQCFYNLVRPCHQVHQSIGSLLFSVSLRRRGAAAAAFLVSSPVSHMRSHLPPQSEGLTPASASIEAVLVVGVDSLVIRSSLLNVSAISAVFSCDQSSSVSCLVALGLCGLFFVRQGWKAFREGSL